MGLLRNYFYGNDANKTEIAPSRNIPKYSAEELYCFAQFAYCKSSANADNSRSFNDNLFLVSYEDHGSGYYSRYAVVYDASISPNWKDFPDEALFVVYRDNDAEKKYSVYFCDECNDMCKTTIINELVRLGSIGKAKRDSELLQIQMMERQRELHNSNKRRTACELV